MLRHLLLTLAGIFAATTALAQATAGPTSSPGTERRSLFPRISGLFGGDLPQLDPPGTFKLILRPHFGDLVRRDYMRVETGLRWDVNPNFELSSEASVFFTHGLADSAGYGIGKLRFGSKYVIDAWSKGNYETTLAATVDLPVGHAPLDMSDGYYHFTPSIVVQHLSTRNPHLLTFTGMGLDLLDKSRVPGVCGTNQPHDDSISVTAGGIYDLGQLKWTFSATYATTALIGNTAQDFFYVQPGVQWYVPSKFTFNSKTQWVITLSARTSWGPDGTDFSLGTKVRAEITFRQVIDKMRARASR